MKRNSFIKVKADVEFRGGLDGMVINDFGDAVGLIFGWDRHNKIIDCETVGVELFDKDELDFSSLDEN